MSARHVSFFTTHKRTLFALLFGLAFSVTVAYAVPPGSQYNAGETLDPGCAPGDSNCSVHIPISQWDDVTGGINYAGGNVGIGTTTPGTALDVVGEIRGSNLTITGDATTVPAPTNLNAVQTCADGCIYVTGTFGSPKNYRVYAYQNTGSGRIYSATYATLSSDFTDDGSTGDNYDVTVSWTAAAGADGYRVLLYDPTYSGANYDQAYDTTSTSFIDDGCGTVCFDGAVLAISTTPNASYTNAATINGTVNLTGPLVMYGMSMIADGNHNLALGSNNQLAGTDNFLVGQDAGNSISNAVTNSVFIGSGAGDSAVNAANSNFFGKFAGSGGINASSSNFFGFGAGAGADHADGSNFFGYQAGRGGIVAQNSNFFGTNAGYLATNAFNSNFFGTLAGNEATNAAHSIFIGERAGNNDTVNNTVNSKTSILIGADTNTGGFVNSILLGSGTTSSPIANTKANQFMLADSITDVRWRGVEYTLPSAQAGGSGYVLSNNGSGVLSWAAGGGGGGTTTLQQAFDADPITEPSINSGSNYVSIWGSGPYALSLNNTSGSGVALDATVSGLGIGASIVSENNFALRTQTQNFYAANFLRTSGNTPTVVNPVLLLSALGNDGLGGVGNGTSIDFELGTSAIGSRVSNRLISKWTNATQDSETSEFIISGTNNSTVADLFTLAGSGALKLNNYGAGSFTGTLAYGLAVDASGNIIEGGVNPITIENTNSLFSTGLGGGLGSNASYSVAIGYGAGENTDADTVGNIYLGYQAGSNAVDNYYSNFIGYQAGYTDGGDQSTTDGVNFIGYQAGFNSTSSNSNFIGYQAGFNSNADESIFIGSFAGTGDAVGNGPGDFSILIGNNTSTGGFSNSIALGANATNTAANQFVIGSTTRPIDSTVFYGTGGTSCTITTGTSMSCSSDERLKTNIEDLTTDTLDTLLNIRTVTYNWNSSPDGNQMVGFLAQDLQQYFPQLVSTGPGDYLQVNYAGMTPILVEAIREMNLKVIDINDLTKDNSWRDAIVSWFGNASNHITRIFTGEICLTDTDGSSECIDKQQLGQLKQLLETSETVVIPPPAQDSVPGIEDPAPADTVSTDQSVLETPSIEVIPDAPATETVSSESTQ